MTKRRTKKTVSATTRRKGRSGAASSQTSDGPLLEVPDGENRPCDPKELLLDPGNLRLLESTDTNIQKTPARLLGQPSIQKRLHEIICANESFSIDELETSIKYNGFLKHERLITAPYDSRRFLVLEGNRRLAAVRKIHNEFQPGLRGLPPAVASTLRTLPCFQLEGSPIDGSEERLAQYRRASEIYIGTRHLMEAKSWEPASRYEFQARLIIDESWSVEQVAERFGRSKTAVVRDLKAQILYHRFREFEEARAAKHKLTYNAFAEAARAPQIMTWIGWSQKEMVVSKGECLDAFFDYLLARVKFPTAGQRPEEDEDEPLRETAEQVVRNFKEMLKLDDSDIEEALLDRQFDVAEAMYYDRREGDLVKRVTKFVRALKRVPYDEFSHNPEENRRTLDVLMKQVQSMIKTLDGMIEKG